MKIKSLAILAVVTSITILVVAGPNGGGGDGCKSIKQFTYPISADAD